MTYIPGGGGGGGGTVSTSSDVALNNPSNGDVLTYDASLQKWKNSVVAADTSKLQAVNSYNNDTQTYPVRPTGYASVQWVGPVDPGAAALELDTWLNTAA